MRQHCQNGQKSRRGNDRQQAERILQESEARFRTMANCAPVLIWVAGTDGLCTFFNQTWLNFTGRTLEQEIGNGWTEGVHPDDFDRCLATYLAAFAARQPFQMDYRLRRADGEYRWILDRGSPQFTTEGEFNGYIGSCQDIHERKEAEELLQLQQAQYQALVTNMPGMVYRYFPAQGDRPHYFSFVSPQSVDLLELAPEVIIANADAFVNLIHPEDLPAFLSSVAFAVEHVLPWHWEGRITTPSGKLKWIEGNSQAQSFGEAHAWDGLLLDISDRRQAEEAKAQLAAIVESSEDAIIGKSLDGTITSWNAGAEKIFGYTAAEAISKPITLLFPDEYLNEEYQIMAKLQRGEQIQHYDTKRRRKDGSLVDLSINISPIKDTTDKLIGVAKIARDISDRKQADSELRATKERLELVLQASSEGFWDWNLVTGEIYFSPQWKAMLGYADHELDNSFRMWSSLIFEEDRIAALQLIENYNSGKVDRFEAIQRFHHKEGSTVYVLSRALHLKDTAGKVVRMVGSHLDITENQRQELALRESEARYRNIIETTMEGVWILDANGLTSFVNPRMATLLGYSPETMLGKSLFAFMTPENQLVAQAKLSSRRQGYAEQHEFEFQRQDGSPCWTLVSATPMMDETTGQYAGAIAMVTDISDRKKMEDKLRKSEAALAEAQRMVHLGNWELDVATKQITWSDELFRIFGFDPNDPEPAYTEHFNYIHPEDRLHLQAYLERAMQNGIPYEIELRCSKPDGSIFYMEARGEAKYNSQGKIEKLFGTALDITERKMAALALAESQKRFQNLVENSPDIIERFDLNLRHLYVSPALTKITGIDPATFLGKTCRDLGMDEQMINAWETAAARLLTTGQKQVIEFATPTLIGMRTFEMAIAPEYSERGEIESILCLSRDITDRKQTELALQESEDRFRILVTHAPVGIFQTDAQGQCLYVNPRWLEMTGLTWDDAMGNGWQQALHPDDHEAIFAEWVQATQDGRPFALEYRFQRPDGGVTWVSGQAIAVHNEAGEIHRYFGTVMDISDRKQTEAELQRQKEMFQVIVDYIPVMIALFDAQGQINFINPEFEQTLGWSLEEWQQQDLISRCYPDPEYRQNALAHIQAAKGTWQDFTIQTATQQHLETSWVYVRLSGGRLLSIGQDISDRKRKETALQAAMEAAETANLAKSMFLANMSHELRTPLNVILGFAQVMSHDPALTPNQIEDLKTIRRSGDHLLNLINDILDLSKIEAGHCLVEETGFDLYGLLENLQSMMAERTNSKGVKLMFNIGSEVPQYIVTDEQKLRQVLLNLLSNAVKFTQQGSITLQVTGQSTQGKYCPSSNSEQGTAHLNCTTHPACRLQFEVIDTGVGISPEEQDRIFDAFVQANAGKKSTGGTGLGLAISKRLIELMGGTITVNSLPEVGTTFTVTVTICPTNGIAIQPAQPSRTVIGLVPGQQHRRILVVDDQRENRLLMVRLLSRIGLEVREARNGQEAIQLWQEWHPDLTWMDIRMPGIDGYEATHQIRLLEPEKTGIIIALTAQASQSDRTLALAAGCDDYIYKPFREDTVFLKMAEYLGLEYEYAEAEVISSHSAIVQSHSGPDTVMILDENLLAQLPPHWLKNLENAARCGDDRSVLELANSLMPEFTGLNHYLADLANQFQFEEILRWVYKYYSENDHASNN